VTAPKLHNASEVAAMLSTDGARVTEAAVRKAFADGLLPGRRPGRFLRFTDADVEIYLERIAVDNARTHAGLTPGSRRRRRTTPNGATR